MKKMLFACSAIALVALGAGCVKPAPSTVAEGPWTIAFALPEGWEMVKPYSGERAEIPATIEKTDSEVWLEVSENDRISVIHIDQRRSIPAEAEDLGNGFKKFDPCVYDDDKAACMQGEPDAQYYLENADGKYHFKVNVEERSLAEAEKIVLSAKRVVTE